MAAVWEVRKLPNERRFGILAGHVIGMDGEPSGEESVIVVNGDRIERVLPVDRYSSVRADVPLVGGSGFIAIPGMINAHHHTGSTLRAGLQDAPFERRNLYLHLLHPGTDEDAIYFKTLTSCEELLRNGVTSVLAFFYPSTDLPLFGSEAALQAYFESGLRVGFALAQRDCNLYTHEDDQRFLARLSVNLRRTVEKSSIGKYSTRIPTTQEYFSVLDALAERWHGRADRIFIHAAPDWTPSCTDELLRHCVTWSTEWQSNIQMHLLETRPEMLFAKRRWGCTAVAHLDNLGVLSPRFVGAHSVWVSREDIDRLAGTGATCVYNPASNLRLFSGISPVTTMIERGVNVTLGMDGLSLADDGDILSDLRLGAMLQRFPDVESDPLPATQVLSLATVNGSRALGANYELGSIVAGAKADIVLLRADEILGLDRVSSLPVAEMVLARAKGKHVHSVFIGGRRVVYDGRVLTIELDASLVQPATRLKTTVDERDIGVVREVEREVIEVLREQLSGPWMEPDRIRLNAL